MAQRKPIIQLKADYNIMELVTVKLSQAYQDGRTVKLDVPAMDGLR
jgi:hypothetical protein